MTSTADLDDLRWLTGPQAGELLHELATDDRSFVALTQHLQQRHSPARAHLLLEQLELRRKAIDKFPRADRMFFTARALEQATDIHVARYKATRFPVEAPVADLCCGIGGDSIALAERGPVTAVDRDESITLLARANLQALGTAEDDSHRHQFLTQDVAQFSVAPLAAWHLDPDRRATGRRTTQLTAYAPGLDTIERLLAERQEAAIKLAPATTVPEHWQEQAELEWIARDRHCRQQVAWFGNLAQSPGLRRATLIRTNPDQPPTVTTFAGDPDLSVAVADSIGRFILEPDASVRAAGLEGALARHYELAAIHPGVPYFTTDRPVDTPILQSFEVTDVLPFDRRRLRSLLHEQGIGRLEIKTRGLQETPEQIRRDLRPRGQGHGVLLLARLGKRVTAILAKRSQSGENA